MFPRSNTMTPNHKPPSSPRNEKYNCWTLNQTICNSLCFSLLRKFSDCFQNARCGLLTKFSKHKANHSLKRRQSLPAFNTASSGSRYILEIAFIFFPSIDFICFWFLTFCFSFVPFIFLRRVESFPNQSSPSQTLKSALDSSSFFFSKNSEAWEEYYIKHIPT